jgi:hypothetical protein
MANRLLFLGLRGNETLRMEVPVIGEKAEYGLVNLNQREAPADQYVCEFRGNTAVSVQPATPRDPGPNWYRLFRRETMRAEKTPLKQKSGYVHPAGLVRWLPQ